MNFMTKVSNNWRFNQFSKKQWLKLNGVPIFGSQVSGQAHEQKKFMRLRLSEES